MTNSTNRFSSWLAILALLLVGCGSSLPSEEADATTTPALTLTSPCQFVLCSWNFLGSNPLSSSATDSSLAIAPNGNMVVAYRQPVLDLTGTYVKRWDGNDWVQVGRVVTGTLGGNNRSRVVLDAAGNPLVASQSLEAPYKIWVSRWVNNAWVNTADLLGCKYYLGVRGFTVDTSGRPVVACDVQVGEFETPQIQIRRWNGTAWVALPQVVGAANPRLMPISNNRLFMAYDDTSTNSVQVSRWNGAEWVKLGSGIPSALIADLKLGINDWPVVAYFEIVPGQLPRLRVGRWNANTFVPVGPRLVETYKGSFPSLAVQGSTIMVAFWLKDFPLQVWRYNATSNSWVQMGSDVYNANSHDPSLALRPSGDPVVAWDGPAQDALSGSKVFVKDYSPALAPNVRILSPANGFSGGPAAQIPIAWSATDPQDDTPLTLKWEVTWPYDKNTSTGPNTATFVPKAGPNNTFTWTPKDTIPGLGCEFSFNARVRLTATDPSGNSNSDFVVIFLALIC